MYNLQRPNLRERKGGQQFGAVTTIMGNQASHVPPATVYFTAFREALPSMAGKTVAITGCTSGTGLVLAKTCGNLGAKVIMINRVSARADAALKTLQDAKIDATLVSCDLQSFKSVREAGGKLRELCGKDGIDVLCNNAGVMGLPDQATPDGFDVQMQSNHLSHFLLTALVWPLLETAATQRGEARVVNHSSGARNAPSSPIVRAEFYQPGSGGNLGGDGFPGLDKWRRYQQSKLANLVFTYALHDHIQAHQPGSTVKVLVAHPGPTDSGLQGKTANNGGDRLIDQWLLKKTIKGAHSVEDGTMGIAICSCSPDVESTQFYGPPLAGKKGKAELLPAERNAANEQLLWEESLKACGISDFFNTDPEGGK